MLGRTILLIDYDPQSIEDTQRALVGAGYRVEVAKDGIAGLRAFEKLRPDLVVIEPMVPRKHGFQVCQEIKGSPRGRQVPVLITTAFYKGRKHKAQAREYYGCDDYLVKPVSADLLLSVCKKLLSDAVDIARAAAEAARPPVGPPERAGSPEIALDDLSDDEIMARLDAMIDTVTSAPAVPPPLAVDEPPPLVSAPPSQPPKPAAAVASAVAVAPSPARAVASRPRPAPAAAPAMGAPLPAAAAPEPPMPRPVAARPLPAPPAVAATTRDVTTTTSTPPPVAARPLPAPSAVAATTRDVTNLTSPPPATASRVAPRKSRAPLGIALVGVALLAGGIAALRVFRGPDPSEAGSDRALSGAAEQAPGIDAGAFAGDLAAPTPAPLPVLPSMARSAESEEAAAPAAPRIPPLAARATPEPQPARAVGAPSVAKVEPVDLANEPPAPGADTAAAPAGPVAAVPTELAVDSASGLPAEPDPAAVEPPPAPAAQRGDLVDLAAVDVAPAALARPAPSYPPIARSLRREGTVVLRLLVDADGRVAEVEVVSGVDARTLDAAAVRAARSWNYRPARKDGVSVQVWVVERVVFKL